MGFASRLVGLVLLIAAAAGCDRIFPYSGTQPSDASSEPRRIDARWIDARFSPFDAQLDGVPPPEPTVDTVPASADFNQPMDVAVADDGTIYVADTGNRLIRVIAAGKVSTLAGDGTSGCLIGKADQARFTSPIGVAVVTATSGPKVYVADEGCHSIRLIENGKVSTVAGTGTSGFLDGPATSARFNRPSDIVADPTGAVYVADRLSHRIRKIVDGTVSTFAGTGVDGSGNGPAASATFSGPMALTLDNSGEIYVVQANTHYVRLIAGGTVSTYAGPLGDREHPRGVAVDSSGRVLVSTSSDGNGGTNEQIRVYENRRLQSTIGAEPDCVDGPLESARFDGPFGLAWHGSTLYVADKYNNRIRSVVGF